ncbi:hypothetical protein [Paraburkholderia sp. DGU8]|uniref:hypothetical protein n=1 Tax=Paraburkholderia sp. DGU8 TaxID=3161997 RepID=UPI0034651B1F
MHLPHHQDILRRATSDTLDSVIAKIRAANPAAFHVEETKGGTVETLSSRVFFDQPVRNEPCKGFVMAYMLPAA